MCPFSYNKPKIKEIKKDIFGFVATQYGTLDIGAARRASLDSQKIEVIQNFSCISK